MKIMVLRSYDIKELFLDVKIDRVVSQDFC